MVLPITNRFELVCCSGNTSSWTHCGSGFSVPDNDEWIIRKVEIWFQGDNLFNVSFKIVKGNSEVIFPKNDEGIRGNNQLFVLESDEVISNGTRIKYEYKNTGISNYYVAVNFREIETKVGR